MERGESMEKRRFKTLKEGVADKVQVIQADLFKSDFSQATVITMFLLPTINLQLGSFHKANSRSSNVSR